MSKIQFTLSVEDADLIDLALLELSISTGTAAPRNTAQRTHIQQLRAKLVDLHESPHERVIVNSADIDKIEDLAARLAEIENWFKSSFAEIDSKPEIDEPIAETGWHDRFDHLLEKVVEEADENRVPEPNHHQTEDATRRENWKKRFKDLVNRPKVEPIYLDSHTRAEAEITGIPNFNDWAIEWDAPFVPLIVTPIGTKKEEPIPAAVSYWKCDECEDEWSEKPELCRECDTDEYLYEITEAVADAEELVNPEHPGFKHPDTTVHLHYRWTDDRHGNAGWSLWDAEEEELLPIEAWDQSQQIWFPFGDAEAYAEKIRQMLEWSKEEGFDYTTLTFRHPPEEIEEEAPVVSEFGELQDALREIIDQTIIDELKAARVKEQNETAVTPEEKEEPIDAPEEPEVLIDIWDESAQEWVWLERLPEFCKRYHEQIQWHLDHALQTTHFKFRVTPDIIIYDDKDKDPVYLKPKWIGDADVDSTY